MFLPARLYILCLLACMIPSCALVKQYFIKGIEKPEVSLEKIHFEGLAKNRINLVSRLLVKNTNDFELHMSEVKFRVHHQKDLLLEGAYAQEIKVPPLGETVVHLPFSIDYKNAASLLKHTMFLQRKTIIDWVADVRFHSAFGSVASRVEKQKQIP